LVPDLSPVEEEIFKAIFSEKIPESKVEVKKEEKVEREILKRSYKLGYTKGYEKGRERGFKEGYEEGLREGYKEGLLKGEKEAKEKYDLLEEKLQAEYKTKIQEIVNFLRNLENEANQLVINLDKEVLSLALKVAQKIVLKEVNQNSEVTLQVIKEALTYLAEGVEIVIKVNPEEWPFLKELLSQISSPSQKINLVPEEGISKGGVFIETSIGIIDATLEKRWERILETLEKDES
ncbi:MAG: FliH/SctL family protein, partial [Thermodesulfobacteriaceae bacterium]|nr:FliH/SctL family protein [Thermodesulfobacteriaceae bacterium]